MNFEEEYEGDYATDGSDIDEERELEHLDDEDFGRRLADMVQREDDVDVDWIPERLRRQQQKRAAMHKRE